MKAYVKIGIGIVAFTILRTEGLKAEIFSESVTDSIRQERIRRPRPDSIPLNYVQNLELVDGRIIGLTEIEGYSLPEDHNATLNETAHVLLKDGELISMDKVKSASILGYENPLKIESTLSLADRLKIHSVENAKSRFGLTTMWAE